MRISAELVKFILAGVVNVLLTFAVYVALVKISIPYAVANAFSWILGIVISYFLNATFVFVKPGKSTRRSIRQFAIFGAAYSVNFFISSVLLIYLVEVRLLDPVKAQCIVIPVIVFLNYSVSKLFIFRFQGGSEVPDDDKVIVRPRERNDL